MLQILCIEGVFSTAIVLFRSYTLDFPFSISYNLFNLDIQCKFELPHNADYRVEAKQRRESYTTEERSLEDCSRCADGWPGGVYINGMYDNFEGHIYRQRRLN